MQRQERIDEEQTDIQYDATVQYSYSDSMRSLINYTVQYRNDSRTDDPDIIPTLRWLGWPNPIQPSPVQALVMLGDLQHGFFWGSQSQHKLHCLHRDTHTKTELQKVNPKSSRPSHPPPPPPHPPIPESPNSHSPSPIRTPL